MSPGCLPAHNQEPLCPFIPTAITRMAGENTAGNTDAAAAAAAPVLAAQVIATTIKDRPSDS